MRGAIPPLSQYAFMAWCFVKHRDNFTFYLLINGHRGTMWKTRGGISPLTKILKPLM
jgi:hypothetical protein